MYGQRPISEDEKMAGIHRLNRVCAPPESPVVVKGREDYERLKLNELFNDADTNQNDYLSFEEMVKHLTNKIREKTRNPEYNLSDGEIRDLKGIFDEMDVDHSQSVNKVEFVNYYMKFKIVIQDKLDRLIERINEAENKITNLNKKKSEAESGLGNFKKILRIYVIEAQELKVPGIREMSPMASVVFEGMKNDTNIVSSTTRPIWNKNFSFFVENPSEKIHIMIWDKSFAGERLVGTCLIDLPEDATNTQSMTTNWYPLYMQDGKPGAGRIRIGIHYIYDPVRIYEKELEEIKDEHERLCIEHDEALEIFENATGPFEKILNPHNQKREPQKAVIKWGGMPHEVSDALSTAQREFTKRVQSVEEFVGAKTSGIKIGNMKWSRLSLFASFSYFLLSSLIMFQREDFINLVLASMLLFVVWYNPSSATKEKLKYLMYMIACCAIFDFVVLLLTFSNYIYELPYNGGVENTIRRLTYFLMIINFILKCPIAVILLKQTQEIIDVEKPLVNDEFDANILINKNSY